eukprot:10316449-Alexandrium_andersonii.AAC.1
MKELLSDPRVDTVVGHMCRFGMQVSEPASAGGGGLLVRKPTRRASSAPEALRRVGLRCANEGLSPSDP